MTLLSRILDFLLPQRAWDRHVSRVIAEFYEEVGPVETWNAPRRELPMVTLRAQTADDFQRMWNKFVENAPAGDLEITKVWLDEFDGETLHTRTISPEEFYMPACYRWRDPSVLWSEDDG